MVLLFLKAGYTPLHTACHFAKINMINFLLRYGANINAKTKLGYTPLHMGAQQGHVLVVKVLLKYNANADELTSVRIVLLHLPSCYNTWICFVCFFRYSN